MGGKGFCRNRVHLGGEAHAWGKAFVGLRSIWGGVWAVGAFVGGVGRGEILTMVWASSSVVELSLNTCDRCDSSFT